MNETTPNEGAAPQKPDGNRTDTDKRTAAKCILDALRTLGGESGNAVSVGTLIEHVILTSDHHLSDVLDEIDRLHTHGEIYQPSDVTIRIVSPETYRAGAADA